MNTYYLMMLQLKTIFEQDGNVNTITTQDDHGIIDNYKKNIYPLVHLNIDTSPFVGEDTTAVTRYNVEINVLDVRDINKEEVNDKFWLNDNRHDNLNTTRAILKKAENKMIKDVLDTGITLETATDAIPVIYAFKNLLDGWSQTWTIDVPDTLTSVCTTLEVESWTPTSENDPYNFDTITFTFNRPITLESGSIEVYYNDATLGDAVTQDDMTVNNKTLTVDISGKMLNPAPIGNYYFTLTKGLVSWKGIGSEAITDDSLAFTVRA